jgi:hypothetical protein
MCGARVCLLVLNKRNTTSLDIEGSTGTQPGNLRNLGKNKAKEVKETSERIYVLEMKVKIMHIGDQIGTR